MSRKTVQLLSVLFFPVNLALMIIGLAALLLFYSFRAWKRAFKDWISAVKESFEVYRNTFRKEKPSETRLP